MSDVKSPRFSMNEWVKYTVTAKNGEFELREEMEFLVVGIRRTSSSTDIEYEYCLSNDPASAYHAGKVSFNNIPEDALRKVTT